MALPQPGDVIRTNYRTGPYRVVNVICKEDLYYFICVHADSCAAQVGPGKFYYLNRYKLLPDGRVQSPGRLPRGSSGYNSIDGHIDDEFRQDEIFIESTAYEELPLFALSTE